MANVINATSTGSGGLVSTGDDSGILNIQTNETTAISISAAQVVNFANAPTVAGSPIGASAATPTALGTVYGNTTSSGTENCAGGYQALNVATGSKNCAFGTYSGFQITSGIQNTLVGSNSGAGMTTGSYNSGVGYIALSATTTGNENSALGYGAGTSNTTGAEIVAIGSSALYSNTTGSNNVAVGRRALYNNTTAIGNVAIGESSGAALTTGSYNIYVGYQTGNATKTSGVDCIYIGRTISPSSAGVNGEMVINTNGNNVTGKGDGTGLIATGGSIYQQNNSSSWATTSDRRLKKNIVDNNEGLDKIAQIKVRNFEYRTEDEITELPTHAAIQKTGVQLGVIAQELQEVCSDCIKEESTGVLRVDSDNVFWHMVNAIKDLKALNDTQAETINALTARIVALETA